MKLKVCLITILIFNLGWGYAQTITVGPYLQKATSTSILIRWYTDINSDSKVTYGTDPGNLSMNAVDGTLTTNHSISLTGLNVYTKYYYSVGTSTTVLQSGSDNYFLTLPGPGDSGKYTFWITGDVGSGNSGQIAVRDRYNAYIGSNITNGWILLGDNAYTDGLEAVYITNFFQVYQGSIMKKVPLWPATGNHEYENNTARQRDHNVAYFRFFDPPTNAEAGGVASGSEAYYSYDYGNIHFVALDSYIIERIGITDHRLFDDDELSPQVQWLKLDLAANTKEWTIVYFHHPPYTKGSHNSDDDLEYGLVKMRENIVPILEQYDVDLVLTGHSHSYERSKLMKGHFGYEASFDPFVHHLSQSSGKYDGTSNSCLYSKDSPVSIGGTVYSVVGSSGQRENGEADFPHNAMYYGNYTTRGSLILDIEENRLDGKWLTSEGTILDKFTIMKDVNKVNDINLNSGDNITLEASWVGQYTWSSGQTTRSITVTPPSSTTYTVADQYGCITDVFNITVTPLPVELVNFTARVDEEKITLSWKTASELNNDFFEVQRFTNAEEIETIGKITGHGTTPETNNYQFVDFKPMKGVAYYRLKQVDYNGSFEYSNVIRTEFDGSRSMQLFPNPGNGTELSLAMGMDEGPLSISVLDARGEKVASYFTHSASTPSSNVQVVKFDMPLSSGMYFIQIKSNVGITTRKWIVK